MLRLTYPWREKEGKEEEAKAHYTELGWHLILLMPFEQAVPMGHFNCLNILSLVPTLSSLQFLDFILIIMTLELNSPLPTIHEKSEVVEHTMVSGSSGKY